jgi:hypothetical protein
MASPWGMMGGSGGEEGGGGSAAISGAQQGAMLGGPIGAVAGAGLGILKGRADRKKKLQEAMANAQIMGLSPWLNMSGADVAGLHKASMAPSGPTGADRAIDAFGTYQAQKQNDERAQQQRSIWENMKKKRGIDELQAGMKMPGRSTMAAMNPGAS